MDVYKFLEIAESKIEWQFQHEKRMLLTRLTDSEGYPAGTVEKRLRLASSALRLRNLSPGMKTLDLPQFLYAIDENSEYGMIRDISGYNGKTEYFRVPAALDRFVAEVEFDVMDDGCVRLVRIELLEKNDKTRPFVQYFMSTEEDPVPEDLVKRAEKACQIVFPVKVTGIKLLSFDMDLDKFTSFIRILADPLNWKEFRHKALCDKLDALMHPENSGYYWSAEISGEQEAST
jgi:hypothetical protein